jgi:hypothetical protein
MVEPVAEPTSFRNRHLVRGKDDHGNQGFRRFLSDILEVGDLVPKRFFSTLLQRSRFSHSFEGKWVYSHIDCLSIGRVEMKRIEMLRFAAQ